MRRFQFRLERLAQLADRRELQARRALGGAVAAVAAVEQRIARVGRDREAALDPLVPARLGAALADAATSRQARARAELIEVERGRERCRTAWLERRAEHRALDQLRSTRRAVWQRAVDRDRAAQAAQLAADAVHRRSRS